MAEENPRPFKCDLCPFTAPFNANLTRHIKAVHDKIRDQCCKECQFKSATKGDLKRHVESVHKKIKKFHCMVCTFSSSTSHGLASHINTHAGVNRVNHEKCQLCVEVCGKEVEWFARYGVNGWPADFDPAEESVG